MNKLLTLLVAGSTLVAAANPVLAQPNGRNRQPSGSPLSSIFSCQNKNNHQVAGAVVGGVVGGVVGNKVAGDDKRDRQIGTVVGAALGAAAGSYIGCKMGSGDVTRAQAATQTALREGRSESWTNQRSGASGRIDIVDTYSYGEPRDGGDRGRGRQQARVEDLTFGQDIERPRDFKPAEGAYQASGVVVLRGGPSQRARSVGKLSQGDTVDAVARVSGADWLLVSRNGAALGYVSEAQLQLVQERGGKGGDRGGSTCRVFDQTYTAKDRQPETQRYTACETAKGEWVIQQA